MSLREAYEAATPPAVIGKRMSRRVRILTLDIETRPGNADVWGLFNQNIGLSQLNDEGDIIGVGMKWLGERKTTFVSDFHGGHEAMLRDVWDAMTEADVIVTYNGDGFDIKHLNWAFEKAGMGKPKPSKSVDLLKVVRRNFRPISKKLDHVSQALGLEGKIQHEGYGLWKACMAGDEKAWGRMARYCKRDVVLTEQLYLRLLQWLPGTAHVGLMVGDGERCPNCTSDEFRLVGSTYANLIEYAAGQCKACGTWTRKNYMLNRVSIRTAR